MALTEFTKDMNIISKLDDEPNDVGGLTSAELKAKFDEGGLALKAWLNETLLPALIAANLAFTATEDIDAETIQAAVEAVYSALSEALDAAKTDLTEDIDGVREDLQGAVMGSIPPTSVTYEKLASDVTNILNALQAGLETAQEDIERLDARQVVIDPVTQTENGLMLAADKVKLDGIAARATRVLVDNALSETSTNAIQNKVVQEALRSLQTTLTTALSGKANSSHTHTVANITDYSVDAEPTEGSNNPVKSGGVYTALEEMESSTETMLNNFIGNWAVIPMRNLGGLMAAQAHQGGHAAYAKNIMASAFQDMHQIATSEHVAFSQQCAELVATGLSSGSVFGETNVSSGGGDFNASDVTHQISTKQSWCKLFDFQPDAFGRLTGLKLQTTSTATINTSASVKLSIWDAESDTMLLETELVTITRGSGEDNPANFNLTSANFILEAGEKYTMKVWIESMPYNSFVFRTLSFIITPIVYSDGSVTMDSVTLPGETKKIEVLMHTTSEDVKAQLSLDSGEFADMTLATTTDDKIPGGTGCKLLIFEANVPTGKESAQLKLVLTPSGCKVYDYAMILL